MQDTDDSRLPWPFKEKGITSKAWWSSKYNKAIRHVDDAVFQKNSSRNRKLQAIETIKYYEAILRQDGVNYIVAIPQNASEYEFVIEVVLDPTASAAVEATLPKTVQARDISGNPLGYEISVISRRLDEIPTLRSNFCGGDPVQCEYFGTCGLAYTASYEADGETITNNYFITCCHVVAAPGNDPKNRVFYYPGNQGQFRLGDVVRGSALSLTEMNYFDGVGIKIDSSWEIADRAISGESHIVDDYGDPIENDSGRYFYRAEQSVITATRPVKSPTHGYCEKRPGERYAVDGFWRMQLVSGTPANGHSGAAIFSRERGYLVMRGMFFASAGREIWIFDMSRIRRELFR